MKDQFGKQLKYRDIVTYPVRQSSNLWMQVGMIYDIDEEKGIGVVVMGRKKVDDNIFYTPRKTRCANGDRMTKVSFRSLDKVQRKVIVGGEDVRFQTIPRGNELPEGHGTVENGGNEANHVDSDGDTTRTQDG